MAANAPDLPRDVFEYDALSSPTSIRLLQVLPQQGDGRIQVELWEQAQAEPKPYRCLSYTWGESSATSAIHVNGRLMEIGNNLYAFLGVAAQRFSNQALWIDAISINQSDNTEKGHQVQRMGNVYKGAIEVLVWLGDDEDISQLFDWTRKPSPLWHKILYYIPAERIPKHLRRACRKLVDHSYWTRAWIVQELAFARSIRLLCSLSESIPDLLKRCERGALHRMFPPTNSLFFALHVEALSLDMAIVRRPTVKPLLDFLEPMTKANPNNWPASASALEPRFDLWMFDFANKKCHEPRDRLYSLLSIANATDFEVTYTESIFATFWRAATYFDVWHEPMKLTSLWTALELSGIGPISTADLADGRPLQCSIATQLPDLTTGSSISTCKHADRFKSRATKGDILLWTRQGIHWNHWKSPHFLIRSDNTSGEDSFVIAMYLRCKTASHAVCLQDAELWYKIQDVEKRIVSWNELIGVVKSGHLCDSYEGITLKSCSSYILTSMELLNSSFGIPKDAPRIPILP